MPTYQYACTACDHAFEQFQSFSDASLTVCPECSGRLRKVFNAVGVVFKGSGFYRTDSRSNGADASNGNGTGSANGSGETTSATTSESSSDTSSGGASSSGSASTASTPAGTSKQKSDSPAA